MDFLSAPRMGSSLVVMKALAIKRSSWGVKAFPHGFEVGSIFLLFFATVAEGVTVTEGGVVVVALLIDDEQFMLCKWSKQWYGPCSEPCPALQIEHTGLPQASLFPPAAEKVQMWWVGMTLHIEQVTEVEEASMMLNVHGCGDLNLLQTNGCRGKNAIV